MTNEKSIKLLSDLYEISRGGIYGDAIKSGLEALEKQDKYGWHDLRKNPADLPPLGVDVLVYDDGWFGVWSLSEIPRTHKTCWEDEHGYWHELDSEIMAWRYIEPFTPVLTCKDWAEIGKCAAEGFQEGIQEGIKKS